MNKIKGHNTMHLTDEQVASFQELYFKTFGVSISKEDALVQGLALLRLVKVLSTPSATIDHEQPSQAIKSEEQ